MKYALFSVPVGTIYDLPQPIKEGETGPVSTIGDEGLYGQACQVRTAPGGVVLNSLDPADPLYREDLVKCLNAVGSIF